MHSTRLKRANTSLHGVARGNRNPEIRDLKSPLPLTRMFAGLMSLFREFYIFDTFNIVIQS